MAARGAYAARKTSSADEEGESVVPCDVGIAVATEEATWARGREPERREDARGDEKAADGAAAGNSARKP
jgi:hypothetical protein